MDKRLQRLVEDFQAAVLEATELLWTAGFTRPDSNLAWAAQGRQGVIVPTGYTFRKHGYGVEVSGPGVCVDFDFGERGQIDCFDAYRLAEFAGRRLQAYGFEDEGSLVRVFEAAADNGSLRRDSSGNYYLVRDTC